MHLVQRAFRLLVSPSLLTQVRLLRVQDGENLILLSLGQVQIAHEWRFAIGTWTEHRSLRTAVAAMHRRRPVAAVAIRTGESGKRRGHQSGQQQALKAGFCSFHILVILEEHWRLNCLCAPC
jgi:hypothetical protein